LSKRRKQVANTNTVAFDISVRDLLSEYCVSKEDLTLDVDGRSLRYLIVKNKLVFQRHQIEQIYKKRNVSIARQLAIRVKKEENIKNRRLYLDTKWASEGPIDAVDFLVKKANEGKVFASLVESVTTSTGGDFISIPAPPIYLPVQIVSPRYNPGYSEKIISSFDISNLLDDFPDSIITVAILAKGPFANNKSSAAFTLLTKNFYSFKGIEMRWRLIGNSYSIASAEDDGITIKQWDTIIDSIDAKPGDAIFLLAGDKDIYYFNNKFKEAINDIICS